MAIALTTFKIDITPPVGTPLCGGEIEPAKTVDDPQYAIGFVLLGAGDPIVLAALDCVGVYGFTHDGFREAIAGAAGASPMHVIISSVHQHDSPTHFLDGQEILDEFGLDLKMYNRAHTEDVRDRLAAAVRESLSSARPVTHIGTGQAKVDRVASNRRVPQPDGTIAVRYSACVDAALRDAPEGLIDPWLKAMTLYNRDEPLLRLYHYATHPMSHYGKGAVSADFCGLARARRQQDEPGAMQMFVNGCAGNVTAGNVTAGKYNDGQPQRRGELTQRMYDAMEAASDATQRHAIGDIAVRNVQMTLPTRDEDGFTEVDALAMLRGEKPTDVDFSQPIYVMAWHRRSKQPMDMPVLDLGAAKLVLLPGEPFIEYQLAAQRMCPDDFLLVLGYGNEGPCYICTDASYDENGGYEKWATGDHRPRRRADHDRRAARRVGLRRGANEAMKTIDDPQDATTG